jgi:hypothetical protein
MGTNLGALDVGHALKVKVKVKVIRKQNVKVMVNTYFKTYANIIMQTFCVLNLKKKEQTTTTL